MHITTITVTIISNMLVCLCALLDQTQFNEEGKWTERGEESGERREMPVKRNCHSLHLPPQFRILCAIQSVAHICQSSAGSLATEKERERERERKTRGASQDWLHCLSPNCTLYYVSLQQRTTWNFACCCRLRLLLLSLFLSCAIVSTLCACCFCCFTWGCHCCFVYLLFVYCYSSANRPTNADNIYTNCLNNCCQQNKSHATPPLPHTFNTKIGPLFRLPLQQENKL